MVSLNEFLARHRITKVVLAHYWGKTRKAVQNRCNDDAVLVDDEGNVYKKIAVIPQELMK